MKQLVWHRLDLLARQLLPFTLSCLLVIVAMVPLRIPDVAAVMPSVTLIAVYYWTIHRPDLMPIWAVFLLGLFQDLIGAAPVGLGILALFVVAGIVRTQWRFFARASFAAVWSLFGLVAAVALLAMWILLCLLEGALLDPQPALFQFIATVAFYPCLSWVFVQTQKVILR